MQGLKYSGDSGLDTQDEHARRKHQISLKGKQTVNVFTVCVMCSIEFNNRLQTCDRLFMFHVLVLLQLLIRPSSSYFSLFEGTDCCEL